MNNLSVSKLIGSSEYQAISDDALKDEDNAAWVMGLEPEVRQAWLESIRWIRLVDRLAETNLLGVEKAEFQQFCQSWQWLMATGQVQPTGTHRAVFQGMRDRWFRELSDPVGLLSIQSWERYLQAISYYHQENLVFEQLSEFDTMLKDLGGSFFQVFPFLTAHQWRMAGAIGMVDQFYNILRDMREDAEQGICYLPNEVLERFGVSRAEILELRAYKNPGYRSMMQFWLYDYLPQIYRKAYPFILAPDLHPSWQILRDWSINRYHRIVRIFRRCDYDYVRFSEVYWQEVRRDLVLLLPERYALPSAVKEHSPKKEGSIAFLNHKNKLFQFIGSASAGYMPEYSCG